jgi:hypothetical protein
MREFPMRLATETRLKAIEELIRLIPDHDDRNYALHLLNAIREDIETNYAEIQRIIGDRGMMRRP